MKLTKQIKQQIKEEYESWLDRQYAGRSIEERAAFGQYFTPSELTIQMLEKFDNLEGTILDPCAGCGGLLKAAIIAGADPKKVYAIEYDPEIYNVLCERLSEVPKENLYCGDALTEWAYDFPEHTKGKPPVQEALW